VDDSSDRGYSRAPELEDLVALCRSLEAEGVRYLLIGGFAVILQGYVRATKDVDLLVDPAPENVQALRRALAVLPDNAAAALADDEIERYVVVRIADEIVVDLMGSACGITWEQAVQHEIDTFDLNGVRVPVASKDLLIRMKDTVRESDAADVRFLRLRLAEEQQRAVSRDPAERDPSPLS
jgi:hypothetical protein